MLYAFSCVIIIAFSLWVLFTDIGRGIMQIVKNKESETAIFSDLVFCGYYHRAQDEKDSRFRRKLWLHELKVSLKRAKAMTKAKPPTELSLVFVRILIIIGTLIIIVLTGVGMAFLADYSYEHSDEVLAEKGVKTVKKYLTTIFWGLLPSLAISLANFILPNIFIKLSRFEKYSLEVTTTAVLFRSLTVRLLAIILTTYKIFSNNYCQLKPNTCVQCKNGHKKVHYCWESLVGQALYKVIFVELMVKVLLTLIVDPLRKAMGKICKRSKLMRRIGTLRFNIIRQSLDIINAQVLCWVGFYFAPAYPFLICFYLVVTFYLKKFAVLHNCVGSPESHRVARTSTIFQMGELVSLLVVAAFLIVVLGILQPSLACGAFSEYPYPWRVVTQQLERSHVVEIILQHINSPSIYMPLEILGMTILYYLYGVVVVNREQTTATKKVMKMESEDKIFLISKLQKLRSKFKDTHFYDPLAIFESEKSFLLSAQQQENAFVGPTESQSDQLSLSSRDTNRRSQRSKSKSSKDGSIRSRTSRKEKRLKNKRENKVLITLPDDKSRSSITSRKSRKKEDIEKRSKGSKTKKIKGQKKREDTDTEAKDTD